jgi:hypothetical protein
MPRNARVTPPVSLDWRPRSYWDLTDPVSAILVNVKGDVRRRILQAALEGTAPLASTDRLMREALPDDERAAWGGVHPNCLGGEYLPAYLPGETEIARIVLESVTRDVISIRARRRRGGTRLFYRVVDEYPDLYAFRFTPRSSAEPLTLAAMLEFIWTLRIDEEDGGEGFCRACIRMNIEGGSDVEAMATFITVESLVYPDLGRLAGERLRAWTRQEYPEEKEPEAAEEKEDA